MPTIERPSLPELQRWMRWVLTHPRGVDSALTTPHRFPKNWGRGPEPRRFLSVIGETSDVTRIDRLSIYGEGYFLRIVDCLANVYSSLKAVVGEHEFDHHLAREYLVKHPSTHRFIDNVGQHFADFMTRRPETRALGFLPDLARLEWAYHLAFYADERPAFDFASLKDRPLESWASATMEIDPSVNLLDLGWPVDVVWRADGNLPRRRLQALKPKVSPILVFRRPDALVRVARIEPAAFALLSALKKGRTFGAALKVAAGRNAAAPRKVMAWFGDWVELGVIRAVRFR